MKRKTALLVTASLCLSLALILPFMTAQIPAVGKMLCPMHFPVLLCGFLTTPFYALAVGLIAPLLRSALFGVPVLFPTAAAMSFELAAYALTANLLYKKFYGKRFGVLIALPIAMIVGRVVLGLANLVLMGMTGQSYTWALFFAGAFTNALPGIALQLIVVPLLVRSLEYSVASLRRG